MDYDEYESDELTAEEILDIIEEQLNTDVEELDFND